MLFTLLNYYTLYIAPLYLYIYITSLLTCDPRVNAWFSCLAALGAPRRDADLLVVACQGLAEQGSSIVTLARTVREKKERKEKKEKMFIQMKNI